MGERRAFLSSTFKDLTDYREAVYLAVQKMDNWHCVRMEDFGSRDREADEFCRDKVAECDLFIGILGLLYGSIHKPSNLSYTEREYQTAAAASRPRLMFLTQDDFKVPGNLMESSAKQKRQKAFRKRVSSEGIRDVNWSSPGQLASSVVTAIHNWEREHHRPEPISKKRPPSPSGRGEELRNRYLRWMVNAYGRLVLYGIQSRTQPYIELALEDIYVPLEALEILPEKELRAKKRSGPVENLEEGQQRTMRPISLENLLGVGPRIVLIGGPGSGKSTVLRHIAWTLAQSIVGNQPELAQQRLGLSDKLPLPILVPLHAFAEHRARCRQAADPELSTMAACIFDYLTREKGATDFSPDFFKALLKEGANCLVMLDGLDEVASEGERELVCRTVESLVNWPSNNRYIVTCRPAAYTGQSVIAAGFRHVHVKPLQRDDVGRLVTKLYQGAGHEERIQPLLTWLDEMEMKYASQKGEGRRLIDSPLMVRMVAIADLGGEKLPEQRSELYDRFVNALVQATYHPDASVRHALEKMGGLPKDQRQWLAVLAHEMHILKAGTRSLEEVLVRKLLCDHLTPTRGKEAASEAVDKFIATIRNRGGLIEVQSGPPDSWIFTHQPFQEFLTAVYLADITDEVSAISEELEKDGRVAEPWWQEVVLLLLGYLNIHNPDKASRLVQRLARLPGVTGSLPPLDVKAQLSAAERAAAALIERPGAPQLLKREVAARLAALIADPTLLVPGSLRAAAGRALALLGDPRPGVAIDAQTGLPDIVWCEVPAGPFIMGTREADIPALVKKLGGEGDWYKPEIREDEARVPDFYYISRYPVTNAQFGAFVEARGYEEGRYWREAEAAGMWLRGKAKRRYYRRKEGKLDQIEEFDDKPADFGHPFNLPNHPVVGVTWYEALAFSKWLNERFQGTGSKFQVWRDSNLEATALKPEAWHARLPREDEWEKAARGTDGRIYPWGKEPDPNRANYGDTGIGATSAVGCFPAGVSPFGALDMSGNVWEWCQTKWRDSYETEAVELLERRVPRVVRGGSWFSSPRRVRCAFRYRFVPGGRHDDLGFRLVVSPGSP